ncbi:MAG: hypothetical protein HYT27_04010 [Parcubacteria group bacterium]|nr:hypothetical protein [Parcubacteria group bacterium]
MEFPLVISAFIAGLLTFLAPCTLPLVPGYLSFISGVSAEEMKDEVTAKRARRKIFLNGVMYVVGFSLIFILFGTLAGSLGVAFASLKIWVARIGGAFVILFGLFMIGLVKPRFLMKERQFRIPFLEQGKPVNSFIALFFSISLPFNTS